MGVTDQHLDSMIVPHERVESWLGAEESLAGVVQSLIVASGDFIYDGGNHTVYRVYCSRETAEQVTVTQSWANEAARASAPA